MGSVPYFGKPIRASIPVRVRFLDAGGAVLHEETTACGSGGKVATWAVPGNVASGQVTFEATELLSGRAATIKANLAPVVSPAGAVLGPKPGLESPVAPPPSAVGVSGSRSAPPRAAVPQSLPYSGVLFVAGKDTGAPAPVEDSFGPHIRDMVLLDGGSVAVANTMNWDHNLYAIDLADGKVRWRERLGDYFAFAPQALAKGFAVQGFDFQSAEGYHLYLAGADGQPERRFALYGVPTRLPHRFVPGILRDRANQFAVADDGSWVAAAGDLGLAVWSRDGKLLWSQDWWKTERRSLFLATAGPDSLLAA